MCRMHGAEDSKPLSHYGSQKIAYVAIYSSQSQQVDESLLLSSLKATLRLVRSRHVLFDAQAFFFSLTVYL